MNGIALVFPGQGSQAVGMGFDMAQKYQEAQEIFSQADAKLGVPLSKLCFHGPEEDLKLTVNTQPAVLAASIACWQVLKVAGVNFDITAGHSLGEYSALVAAGVIEFTDALGIVRERGRLMEEALPAGQGGMAAIMGLPLEKVEEICKEAAVKGVVVPANYNSPGQLVIAGDLPALDMAVELAKQAGAKRVIPLQVSGPFHSPRMQSAGQKLAQALAEIPFKQPKERVVANVTANFVETPEEIRAALVRQVSSPVRWEESVRKMVAHGVDTFIEVGPGTVLSGLIKKINKDVRVMNIQDPASLEKTVEILKGVG
ncbi:MAG: ACP S-malonyltransferase [Syntrophomonadaceae bacterium]|jgi:[acyl-carrier-protein] S-malonyltransferase|nr:ACP S-malonyltransferase [Syntrophomonadaceae bacterium]